MPFTNKLIGVSFLSPFYCYKNYLYDSAWTVSVLITFFFFYGGLLLDVAATVVIVAIYFISYFFFELALGTCLAVEITDLWDCPPSTG